MNSRVVYEILNLHYSGENIFLRNDFQYSRVKPLTDKTPSGNCCRCKKPYTRQYVIYDKNKQQLEQTEDHLVSYCRLCIAAQELSTKRHFVCPQCKNPHTRRKYELCLDCDDTKDCENILLSGKRKIKSKKK